jgi:hypothetical protein
MARVFDCTGLASLVKCAKRALETEDRRLANGYKIRRWNGAEQGICAYWNERYYQCLIWSELICSFEWRPKLEWHRYDLALFDDETSSDIPVACAEIKLWASKNGRSELPTIQADINKLRRLPMPGVMLILTAHWTSEAKANFDWLAKELDINKACMETDSFAISTEEKGNWEFAIIGFVVPQPR